MADKDPLPNGHQIARLCGTRGVDNGIVTSAAFALRPKDECRLSADWVQCSYVGLEQQNISGCSDRLRAISHYPQYAVFLQVDDIRKIMRDNRPLDVLEAHTKRTKCHCAIVGMQDTPEDLETQGELADLANDAGRIVLVS